MSQINVAYVAAFLIFHSYVYGSYFYLRKCHVEVKLLFSYTEVDFRKCICKTEVDFRKASEISRKSNYFFPSTEVDFRKCMCETEVDFQKCMIKSEMDFR